MLVNNKFRIRWQYDGNTTSCTIFDITTKQVAYEASIRKHPNDKPDKEKARKFSLEKVLQNLPKQERNSYWEAYRTSKKGNRW